MENDIHKHVIKGAGYAIFEYEGLGDLEKYVIDENGNETRIV